MKFQKKGGVYKIEKANENQKGPKIGNNLGASETRVPSVYPWK